MEWTPDVTAGDWLQERIDRGESWARTMHGVVPRGFDAYARILHRPLRGGEPSTWAQAAAAFGTRVHAEAQWNALVRAPEGEDWHDRTAPDGTEFHAPQEGNIDADLLAAVAEHLAAATKTPSNGYVALWAGWGGLLGFLGETPSRTFFSFVEEVASGSPDDPAPAPGDASVQDRHRAMLERSIHDPFNNVFRKPTWQPGILSDEISRGPQLTLPGREHVLFRGGISELADPEWVLHVPWRDREAEQHGFPPDAQSPSLAWPDDHAWVLVTEVDYDSTIVGGTRELIDAVCADPRLEAFPLRADADLTWSADRVNS